MSINAEAVNPEQLIARLTQSEGDDRYMGPTCKVIIPYENDGLDDVRGDFSEKWKSAFVTSEAHPGHRALQLLLQAYPIYNGYKFVGGRCKVAGGDIVYAGESFSPELINFTSILWSAEDRYDISTRQSLAAALIKEVMQSNGIIHLWTPREYGER